jgi:hypothetical protein
MDTLRDNTEPEAPRSRLPRYGETASAVTGPASRVLAARAIAASAAASISFLLMLPYVSIPVVSPTTFITGSTSETGWQTLDGSDILMTVCSVAVVGCVALDLFVAPGRWLRPAAAIAPVHL